MSGQTWGASDIGDDPADAAQASDEAENAARDAEIMSRTYHREPTDARGLRCAMCQLPLRVGIVLVEGDDGRSYCSTLCARGGTYARTNREG